MTVSTDLVADIHADSPLTLLTMANAIDGANWVLMTAWAIAVTDVGATMDSQRLARQFHDVSELDACYAMAVVVRLGHWRLVDNRSRNRDPMGTWERIDQDPLVLLALEADMHEAVR